MSINNNKKYLLDKINVTRYKLIEYRYSSLGCV